MPRIAASSVREHRALMQAKLLDAAEQILHSGDTLTAGGVAAAVGIARNSVYRYVDSVDELQVKVLNKYLPRWTEAVVAAIEAAPTPHDRVLAYVRTNLEQAAPDGHAWLMHMAQTISDQASEALQGMHTELAGALDRAVHESGVDQPDLVVKIIDGITLAGFARLDAGDATAPVVAACVRAADAVIGGGASPLGVG